MVRSWDWDHLRSGLDFILSGNSPAFPMISVPKSHFNGLDMFPLIAAETLISGKEVSSSIISDLTRQTARKWLVSMEPQASLPDNVFDIEKIALRAQAERRFVNGF